MRRRSIPTIGIVAIVAAPIVLVSVVIAIIALKQRAAHAFTEEYLACVRRGADCSRDLEAFSSQSDASEIADAKSIIKTSTGQSVGILDSSGENQVCANVDVIVNGTKRRIGMIVERQSSPKVSALSARRECTCKKSPKCWLAVP